MNTELDSGEALGSIEQQGLGHPSKVRRLLRWLPLLLVPLLVWGAITTCFGSVRGFQMRLNGHEVMVVPVDETPLKVPADRTSKVEISVRNLQFHAITIFGSNSSCSCVATSDLPMTIPPLSERQLSYRYQAPAADGPQEARQVVELLIDPADHTVNLVLNFVVGASS
ncbi:hypothetical protein Pan189_35040 [Stratiformator vulcanicus]|uniref:DUF1573 domain-containing protein n=1 Tax=Stratiformator vulcanicus TaxID=2527980 RepID=A0A517R5F4_9PLAN|nr:hypothetical protein Pan189_35040 [Stratiformator vulcanicus]